MVKSNLSKGLLIKTTQIGLLLFFWFVSCTGLAQQAWTETGYGAFGGQLSAVAGSGGNIIVGSNYGIWLSSDNGNTWHPSNSGLSQRTVLTLYSLGALVFAGTTNGVFVSTYHAASWVKSGR